MPSCDSYFPIFIFYALNVKFFIDAYIFFYKFYSLHCIICVFHCTWGCLPFFRSSSIFLRSSSIFFWGRLSSWVKIRLHTENQLPKLPGSGACLMIWWIIHLPKVLFNGQPLSLSAADQTSNFLLSVIHSWSILLQECSWRQHSRQNKEYLMWGPIFLNNKRHSPLKMLDWNWNNININKWFLWIELNVYNHSSTPSMSNYVEEMKIM